MASEEIHTGIAYWVTSPFGPLQVTPIQRVSTASDDWLCKRRDDERVIVVKCRAFVSRVAA